MPTASAAIVGSIASSKRGPFHDAGSGNVGGGVVVGAVSAGDAVGVGATLVTGSSVAVSVVAGSVVALSAGAVSATAGAVSSDSFELESLPHAARLTTVMMTGRVRDRIGRNVLSTIVCVRRNRRARIGRIDAGLEERNGFLTIS
jgi:hypothetical protein